jgi:hypothetical protein
VGPVTDQPRRVLLLEPSPLLRQAIQEALAAEGYQVLSCQSVEHLVASAREGPPELALAAWQCLEGLLVDDRLHELAVVSRRLRLVPMVPRGWLSVMRPSEMGLAGVLGRPVLREELQQLLAVERQPAPLIGEVVEQHVLA